MQTYKRLLPNHDVTKIKNYVLGIDLPFGYDERIKALPKAKNSNLRFLPSILDTYRKIQRQKKWERRWFLIKYWGFWSSLFLIIFVASFLALRMV